MSYSVILLGHILLKCAGKTKASHNVKTALLIYGKILCTST